jgi:hypothetical protein
MYIVHSEGTIFIHSAFYMILGQFEHHLPIQIDNVLPAQIDHPQNR